MIIGLQIIAVTFILCMLYLSYINYKKGDINGIEMLFLIIGWFGAVFIVVFPEFFKAFSETIAISRTFDLAVIGGFIFVIPLIYMAYIRSKRIEKKLEEFIRKEALKEADGAKKR